MEGLITGRLAEIFKADRSAFNARFAAARHARPALDPAAFSDLLRSTVAPIAQAVDWQCPDKTSQVVHVLYDLALDLLGQGLLGPNSRYPFIAQAWKELLPGIPHVVGTSPQVIVGSVTNALYNLSITPGARPAVWIERMASLGASLSAACPAPPWLQAGQVVAWQAGLAHFRPAALELCKILDPIIVRTALGLPATDSLSIETLIARLAEDPWLDPARVRDEPGEKCLALVARVGAFRGLGGLFLAPPSVACAGEHFIVTDGDSSWLLVADSSGATWHRGDKAGASTRTAPFRIDREGQVTCDGYRQTFPELAGFSSAASNGTTLAVTTPLSFAVHLVALTKTRGA